MDIARMGGFARARSLTPARRRSIARKAVKARWDRRRAGVVAVSEIRRVVASAMEGRNAEVRLFGSYVRSRATPESDIDIMVIFEKIPSDMNLMDEFASINRKLSTLNRPIDLLLVDRATYDEWKEIEGTVHHDVAVEGVILV